MKKSGVLFILTLSLINFVSAYYGSYSSFSLSDLLNEIDSSTMILGAIFIISFALVNFALVRVFRDNRATAGVVAFVVSLFITWGINRTGFDFEELFYGIGFSEGLLYTILPLVLLAGVIFLGIRFGFGITLMIFGLLLIIITVFTEIIYENGVAMVIGCGLIGIGYLLQRKKKQIAYSYRRPSGPGILRQGARYVGNKYDWEKEKKQAKVIGRGIKGVASGAGWAGRKAKTFAQKEWQKEKDVMRERAEKLRQKKDELIQGKKEKLFLEFNKLKKDMTQIDNQLSKLDSEKNYNYINNLKWQRNKLSKNADKIADKLRKLGYPI